MKSSPPEAGPPEVAGVTHRYVTVGDGVTIHVADAGPADGRPVMLVHGFPQHWWEWRHLIGPLAAAGYRVLCPDLRGAGWSSAPAGTYPKTVMADDLAAVVDKLGVGPVTLAAHDWGGPVAFLMMVRHPDLVTGFFGMNTVAPWLIPDLATARHLWRFWYQVPIALPIVGPLLLADRRQRFLRRVAAWVGAGWTLPAEDLSVYAERFRRRDRGAACSRWYRTFLTREFLPWLRGEFADVKITVPVRWLHGTSDPVLTPTLLREYSARIDDFQIEWVGDAGHWIAEQRPELVLHRLGEFVNGQPQSDVSVGTMPPTGDELGARSH